MRKTLKEQLPAVFTDRMETLLGSEYSAFYNSYDEKTYAGLRMNTLKITAEEYLKLTGQELEPVPGVRQAFTTTEAGNIQKIRFTTPDYIIYKNQVPCFPHRPFL